jgi:lipopolysaccharide transport system permease protein
MSPAAESSQATSSAEWTLEPRSQGTGPMLRDVWRYRRLLRFFGSRALQKIYARTVLGWSWIFIRPLFPLIVNTFVFSGVLAVSSGNVPYFLFLVVGTASWELFTGIVMWGTRSLELNRGLMARIYIPRLILPIAMATPAWLTFVIHIAVVACAMVFYRVTRGTLFMQPSALPWALQACLLVWVLGLGISLWTSVPAIVARDVRFTLNYVLGFWVFLTPVMYPLSSVPEKYRWLIALNPMTPAVESFKYGVLGIGAIDSRHLLIAWGFALVVLGSGLLFFMKAERTAADRS